jgi:UDP-GlcNAc:undecaprenyl-phosphate GlcNAc-1-phosphate transferase
MTSLVVAALVAAAGLSWAFCGLVRRVASDRGAVVPPRSDRWHSRPTPTMGGTGFGLATLLVASGVWLWMGTPLTPQQLAVPAAAAAMLVIGLFDDRLQLSPLAKLVSSLIIGALVVFVIGAGPSGSLPWPATILAVVWFGGVVHALNLLDNMDGLAAGIALCGAALLAYLFAPVLGDVIVVFLAALTGAAGGFLYWNRHPARLFMGDSGSLFLGASLAGVSLMPLVSSRAEFWHTAAVVLLVLAVPLFDTGFVLVLRRLAGRQATRGGTDHLSHRLVSLGFSERSAVRILYLFGLAAGLVAFLVQSEGLQPMLPLAALFLVAAILVGIYLARVPAYDAEDFRVLQKSTFTPFLRDLAFKWHVGQVLLDVVLIAVCYYAAYRIRFEGEMLENFFPYFTASLPFVIGCKLGALYVSGLYWRSWDSFALIDLFVVVRGVIIGSVLSVLTAAYIYRLEGFSRAVFLIDAVLLLLAVAGTRASFRAMGDLAHQRRKTVKRVVVYGAGAFGQLLVREMRANPDWSMRTLAFVDDNPALASRYVLGVRVAGGFEALEGLLAASPVDDVVLSSPAIDAEREAAVRELCARHGIGVRRLHMSVE